ncbi:hypothetical protein [Pseudomonas weihenstephanensis]|uniref:hypothetical protein n=1 Tax=Pseudomonas weihenstephanensis TaxID=1608994 RepID=UPI001EEEE3FF|nr:hypothetical protein [Pseudomonas weihenstephanensis]
MADRHGFTSEWRRSPVAGGGNLVWGGVLRVTGMEPDQGAVMKVEIEKHDGSKYTYSDVDHVQDRDQYKLVLVKDGKILAIENKGDIKNLHTVEPS